MNKQRKSVSEQRFQERFVQSLVKNGWTAPDKLNGNTSKVTVLDLVDFWREQLNNLNQDQLEGVKLTDNEFQQVLAKVGQINNSYEAAQLLAMESGIGKIDGIYRDRNPAVTRSQITLTIFRKAEVGAGNNTYNVAREVVSDKTDNRFDIVLLINGLPLINVEQKRTDQNLIDAFGQFKRYYREGEYQNSIMVFSQMMVITSEIMTRYFATPRSLSEFNEAFIFHWADKNNRPINDWRDITKTLLNVPMAHQMVSNYLIIEYSANPHEGKHMLMRPYQVYALQAIENAATGRDNILGKPHGGYVWHTTGSGKTVTSFKTALFLSNKDRAEQIVFLLDRKDLDYKTSETFMSYSQYETLEVKSINSSCQLESSMKTSQKSIIVSTIFKMDNMVKRLEENQDHSLKDKRFIFIFDEAHRSTMGTMMVRIKSYFGKNTLFYGFTGTPLFDENIVQGMITEGSQLIDTTEKLFGEELHKYTIDEAIQDGNVLAFNVNYIRTFPHYSNLREEILKRTDFEISNKNEVELEMELARMSDFKVENKAIQMGLVDYNSKEHIEFVVDYILKRWEYQSLERNFNALLTVGTKDRARRYYQEFKDQLQANDMTLNIVLTYSFDNENNPDQKEFQEIEKIFADYEEFTGQRFIAGDKRYGEAAFFEDVVSRSTRGGSGRNPKNIDLIIVAEQLLTGYDNKYLNTLYVDRSLALQSLVQAYSRTNRVYGEGKDFGSIVNFQSPEETKKQVEEALKLYSSGGSSTVALVATYEEAVSEFSQALGEMERLLPNPTDWQEFKGREKETEEFLQAFSEANILYDRVRQYYVYEWDESVFGMSEHQYMKYIGAYRNIKSDDDDDDSYSVIKPIHSEATIDSIVLVDADYIINLIGEKTYQDNNDVLSVTSKDLEFINEKIKELSDMGDYEEAEMISEFLEERLKPRKISGYKYFDEAYADWKEEKRIDHLKNFADEWKISFELLKDSADSYSLNNPDFIPLSSDLTRSMQIENDSERIIKQIKFGGELKKFIREINKKFEGNK